VIPTASLSDCKVFVTSLPGLGGPGVVFNIYRDLLCYSTSLSFSLSIHFGSGFFFIPKRPLRKQGGEYGAGTQAEANNTFWSKFAPSCEASLRYGVL